MERRISSVIILIFILSGCGIGGFWMNGDPSGGRGITPLRDYWQFPGGTDEQRKRHWVECGGLEKGGYGISPPGLTRQEMKKADDEKFDQLQICMMKMGYQYMDSCEGEIRSTYPACIERKKREL